MNPQIAGAKPAKRDWTPKRVLTVVPLIFFGARSIIQATMTGPIENKKKPRSARTPTKRKWSLRMTRATKRRLVVRSPAVKTERLPFLSEMDPERREEKIPEA